MALHNTSTGILEISSCIRSANPSVKTPDTTFWQSQFLGMTHNRLVNFVWMMLSSVNGLWVANCFNTTTFLLNSWPGLFKVVYPRLYDMSWRHFTVSMNPEFLVKFTLGGNVANVGLIKWFYGESTLCTSPQLHSKLNAIHSHATWQHHSPSPLTLKIEKCCCQIARFAGGPYILVANSRLKSSSTSLINSLSDHDAQFLTVTLCATKNKIPLEQWTIQIMKQSQPVRHCYKAKHLNLFLKKRTYLPNYKTKPQIKLMVRKNIFILISYTQYTKHVRLYVPCTFPESCFRWSLNISFATSSTCRSEAIYTCMNTRCSWNHQ